MPTTPKKSIAARLGWGVTLSGLAVTAVGALVMSTLPEDGAGRTALVGTLAALALAQALFVVLWTSLWVLRPLGRLRRLIKDAEETGFLQRAPVERDDELGSLARDLNGVLARVTSLQVSEIDSHRDLEEAHAKLSLRDALEQSNRSLENRIRELSLLFDLSRGFTAVLELPELQRKICSLVAERLGIPRVSLMLRTTGEGLEVRSAIPVDSGAEGQTFILGEGACGEAASRRTALYLPDIATDPRFTHRPGTTRSGSLYAIPMIHRDTLLGVLNFERPETGAFSEEERALLSAVADQAALAIKNALLHEETVALSVTDALTGAPNRRHLFTRLEMELARANRFGTQLSVLMIDIDHFKLLNDTAGHRAGDEVLKQVYELMGAQVRRVDTLARYGGEEFMLLLPQVAKTEAMEVANKLRSAIADAPLPHAESQPEGRITVSIGVASLPADGTALEELVDCADSALYASKRGGRNKVTGYAAGMEQHPGRERGPNARIRRSQPQQSAGVA